MLQSWPRRGRKDKAELRQKLHDKLQDAVELESKLVPMREKIATLEEARKTDAEQMAKLEKRSTERETLLGKSNKIGTRPPKN